MQQKKRQYVAPKITVVDYRMELGFAYSDNNAQSVSLHNTETEYALRGNEATHFNHETWNW